MPPYPLSRFAPDQPRFNPAAGDGTLNVLPMLGGWKPMSSFEEVSDALVADCKGLFLARGLDGNWSIFAGTAANLYKLNTSTSPYSWTEVSKSTDAYSLPEDDNWSFAQYGDFLIACQLGNPPQVFELTGGTNFADLGGSPPTARYVKTYGLFLVFLYTDGNPNEVRWSALADHTTWTKGFNYADAKGLETGYEITGAAVDPSGGLTVFMREAVYQMIFGGNAMAVFSFTHVRGARGALAPAGIVEIGDGRSLYLSDAGFYEWPSGAEIGAEKVDQFFYDNVDSTHITTVQGHLDPFEKIVWWRYEKSDGTAELLGYDWQLGEWTRSNQDLQQTAKLVAPGITWDGLDALYATIDDVDVPFDSRIFKGGSPVFAGITTNGKLAFAQGGNLAATMETAELELNPGRRAFVNGGRLVSDATSFTAQIGAIDQHGETMSFDSAISPSTGVRKGFLGFRKGGRLHQAKFNIAAGATWSTASGAHLDFVDGGA